MSVFHLLIVGAVLLGTLSAFYPDKGGVQVASQFFGWILAQASGEPANLRWQVLVISFTSILTNAVIRLLGDCALWAEIQTSRNGKFDVVVAIPLFVLSNLIPSIILGIQFQFIPNNWLSYIFVGVSVFCSVLVFKLMEGLFKDTLARVLVAGIVNCLFIWAATAAAGLQEDWSNICILEGLFLLTAIVELIITQAGEFDYSSEPRNEEEVLLELELEAALLGYEIVPEHSNFGELVRGYSHRYHRRQAILLMKEYSGANTRHVALKKLQSFVEEITAESKP